MNTFYHSTRSCERLVTSKQAIQAGLADDGGLYVSDSILGLASGKGAELIGSCLDQGFATTSKLILGALLDDFSEAEIASCVDAAYTGTFSDPAVTPVTPVGDAWLLELFHGPTCAFKDVALQILPQLMAAARPSGDTGRTLIVTATSGDTGKAALAGFSDAPGTGICVFYPDGGVSDVQRLQMATQSGSNVSVAAVRGNFDDIQTRVKAIFGDAELGQRLAEGDVRLSSANSINVGRLVPQIVYYVDAYAQLLAKGAIKPGDELEFVVPTGNFGDVLAGYYAKLMGLPISRLVVAANQNDVLFDFLRTGVYDKRRSFYRTISPSMDILVSSNLERLLYLASAQAAGADQGDAELIAHLMADLAAKGRFTAPEAMMERIRDSFEAGRASEDETRAAIRSTWEGEGVLIDPHTAVAKRILDERAAKGETTGAAQLVLSTASPFKFPAEVLAALGVRTEGLDGFACMDALSELSGQTAPAQLASLRDAEILHEGVVDIDQMAAFVEAAAERCLA